MAERTMTSQQVAQELRVSAASVQRYAREGRIPFDMTPGGHRRYSVEEVRSALAGGPRVHTSALPVSAGKLHLAAGAPVRTSLAEQHHRAVRAVQSGGTAAAGQAAGSRRRVTPSATAELLGQARRVLVATAR